MVVLAEGAPLSFLWVKHVDIIAVCLVFVIFWVAQFCFRV